MDSKSNGVTLCVTAGGRPELLERTLRSMLGVDHGFAAAVIANDAGDPETNEVVRKYLPSAKLLSHAERRGQIATVDEMYSFVDTPFIFHCEDDWEFDQVPFLPQARAVLEQDPAVSVVSVRQTGCSMMSWRGTNPLLEPEILPTSSAGDTVYVKVPLKAAYSSFTFNPSLLRTSLWQSAGGYSKIASHGGGERTISKYFQGVGLQTAYLLPGVCYHIGWDAHVQDPFVSRRLRRRYDLAQALRRFVRRINPWSK
jgi:hypothetical protein